MNAGAHVYRQDDGSHGNVVIDAVIRAGAIDRVEQAGGSCVIIWQANAAEQIEAALSEFGFRLIPVPESGFDVTP